MHGLILSVLIGTLAAPLFLTLFMPGLPLWLLYLGWVAFVFLSAYAGAPTLLLPFLLLGMVIAIMQRTLRT